MNKWEIEEELSRAISLMDNFLTLCDNVKELKKSSFLESRLNSIISNLGSRYCSLMQAKKEREVR